MWEVAALILLQVMAPSGTEETLTRAAPILAEMEEVSLVAYRVPGRSVGDIRANMDALRPGDDAGHRYDALTSWSYGYGWRMTGETCQPQTSQVTLTVKIILPVLADYERLNPVERTLWDRYFTALTAHEANHVRLARIGQQQMVARMRAASSCDELIAITEEVSQAVAEASQEYDDQTDHGKREGAVFP